MNDIASSNKVLMDTQAARILYLIHGATFLLSFGLLSIIPLFFNYIKRGETQDSFVHTHHSWMISSWWIYVGLCALAGLLFVTIIGIPLAWLLFCGAWVYKAYRLLKGFMALNANQPVE